MIENKKRKCIKWKIFDLFSTPYNFTYKRDDKYSTTIGGIVTIIYILLIIAYLIYKFIPFVKKDNYELVYLEENMDSTDSLLFKENENDLAYRLEYKNNSGSSATCEDLLEVKINYIYSKKASDSGSSRDKKSTPITTFNCDYDPNKHHFIKINNSQKYQCFHHQNEPIKNVYNDLYFTYYEIIVSLRDSQKENFTNANNFLLTNDCKLELYYLDYTIKVEDYKNPIVPYQNLVFLQLSPVSILEMNVYFMKQILKDQSNVLFEKEKTRENTVFSRVEQYSYYKGDNRMERKNKFNDPDYNIYSKIFIRADTKILKVKRNYQTLGGFWADNTSIFWDLFTFCNFFIGVAYNFLSYHSLSKKIFYFTEIENKNFNYYPNNIRLKEIIKKIDNIQEVQIPKDEMDKIKVNIKASMNTMNFSRKNTEDPKKTEFPDSFVDLNLPQTRNNTMKQNTLKSIKDEDFSYGPLDIYNRCCMRCKYQKNYPNYKKANEIITDKLDVVLYVRNTILLDIISKTVIGDKRANIVQFLSVPIVSLKDIKNENEKNNIFVENTKKYRKYLEKDFESCERELTNLADKEQKGELDKNLILYTKKQMEELKKLNED